MKLAEALSIVQRTPVDQPLLRVELACGFTPLHLQNFLAAHLQKGLSDRKVHLTTGLYDDVAGTLEQFAGTGAQACVLVLEWADLDPRLGYRQLGGWGTTVLSSIQDSVESKLRRLESAIATIPLSSRIVVSLPTLLLPPAFHTTGWQASQGELDLEAAVLNFARRIATHSHVLIVNQQTLDARSSPESRYDLRSDLHTGFPYTIAHADALGAALAALVDSPTPKKGLITDLDDTLWSGLVGEVGHENVCWDLAGHAQLHGLYQQMLQALASQGVLVAIASKNSPDIAEKALARRDLAVARDKIFPIEIHWEPKSGSVSRILQAWNIGPDSVVFVDDSVMELEEVRAAFPSIECILFPKSDYAAGLALLRRLRDLFGKPRISEEDSYRLDSIRANQQLAYTNGTSEGVEQFLASAEAVIDLHFDPPPSDRRIIELVNKTNQFNLNGVRFTAAEWQESLRAKGAFSLAVSYRDKFGPLGKIAVIKGANERGAVHIDSWVMSCRAFSRRIEHQCIAQLFRRFEADEMTFAFKDTPKNAPVKSFLTSMLGDGFARETPLTRKIFEDKCPALHHTVSETNE